MKITELILKFFLLSAVMLAVISIVPLKHYFRMKKEETVQPQSTNEPESTYESVQEETAEPEPAGDELKYVYYELLDEDQKSVYGDALAAAEEGRQSFEPSVLLPAEEIKPVLEALFYDHAELFWLDISYSYMYDDQGLCHQVMLDFNEAGEDLEAARERFADEASLIIDEAETYDSDYEKERFVHDTLLDRIEYDEEQGSDQSAYGALTEGRAVCAGYARAFQYIMNELGIPVYYVTGTAEGIDHAWNIILLEGQYYNVDLTWDDMTPDRYIWFDRSDAFFAEDHERTGVSENLASCPADYQE